MKKVLAVLGIIFSLVVITGAVVWMKYGDTIMGAHQAKKFIETQGVPREQARTVTLEQKKLRNMTPEEKRSFLVTQQAWKEKLRRNEPAKVPYDTKGINYLILHDMQSKGVLRDSFLMEIKDGKFVGQATIASPLEEGKWLNLVFSLKLEIHNFQPELTFINLGAIKNGKQTDLGDKGRKLIENEIRKNIEKQLKGDPEVGGVAADLYYIKELSIQNDKLVVEYDPQRYKAWNAARLAKRKAAMQAQPKIPAGGRNAKPVKPAGTGEAKPAPEQF